MKHAILAGEDIGALDRPISSIPVRESGSVVAYSRGGCGIDVEIVPDLTRESHPAGSKGTGGDPNRTQCLHLNRAPRPLPGSSLSSLLCFASSILVWNSCYGNIRSSRPSCLVAATIASILVW